MKVFQIVSSVYPINIGGVEVHVYNLSKELVKRGFSVEILTKNGVYAIKNEELVLIEKCRYFKILKYLLLKDYDLVHIHNWGAMPLGLVKNEIALLICKLRKKKIVITPHGFPEIISSTAKKSIKARIFLIFSKFIFTLIDKFVCVHPQQEETLNSNFSISKDKMVVIPNGISELAFEQHNPMNFVNKYKLNGKRILCYIGRLAPNKRLSDAIEVMSKLKRKDNISLVIIGPDGGDMANLLNLIDKYNLKNVILLGELNEKEKYQALSAADIFLSTSSSEAFGISTCEAMAQGVPVISANNIGAKYLLNEGKYGSLYEIGDTNSLLEKILYFLENPKKAKRMGEKGRKRTTKFKWSKIVGEVEKVYKELLEKNKRMIKNGGF